MDNLPSDCVEHFLSFLPIADVFVCRSVCQKWKGAADSVIRGQKELKFYVVENNMQTGIRDGIVLRQSEHPVRPDDETPVSLMCCWRTQPNERNADVWTKRLEGMVRLEKLVVFPEWIFSDFQILDDRKWLVDAVIMRNALTLTTINMRCSSLPLDHKLEHPVLVYGKLRKLVCRKLTPAAAVACPRLVRLRTGLPLSAEVIQNLPHETMQYLQVECKTQTPQGMETFGAAVSRLTQLKDLTLDCRGMSRTSTVNPDLLLTKVFSNLKQLEKIEIQFPYTMDGTVDLAIDRLVRNNPRLTHIHLKDAYVTGASLVSLSRLTSLQRLSFWFFGTDNIPEFTADDILMLLRGGSRKVLREVRMDMRSRLDRGLIEAEVKIMGQEMGCTFSISVTSVSNVSLAIERWRNRREAA